MRHHGVYGDYWQIIYFQTARKIVGKGAHSSKVVQPATHIARPSNIVASGRSAWIGQCIKPRLTRRSLPDCEYESAL